MLEGGESPKVTVVKHLNAERPLDAEAHFALDVSGGVLSVFQLLHQRNVSQKIAVSRRQPVEQVVLQSLQLDFEVVLLHGQLHLGSENKHFGASFQ